MKKCPNCAEENIFESLFCKHCGRCLLSPDPEVVKWSIATEIELHKTQDGLDFHEDHLAKKPVVVYSPKRRPQTRPAVIEGWLLLLNLLGFILMFEIVRYIVTR
jgi:hypothetical protein